jgi:hypothetical protein
MGRRGGGGNSDTRAIVEHLRKEGQAKQVCVCVCVGGGGMFRLLHLRGGT